MGVKEIVRPLIRRALEPFIGRYLPKKARSTIEDFAFDRGRQVSADIEQKYGRSDLADIFASNGNGVVHKWHHYFPVYERYFSRFRNRPVRFLEIGVSQGGSLQMWRTYFGDRAIIFGIDVDEDCRAFDGRAAQVRVGSQDDPAFLKSVVEEMGGLDLVLDDGSHHMAHIPVSLEVLFPLLSEDGVYMIEDLHTAYWKHWGGGYSASKNFFKYVGEMVDDMHRWYHEKPMVHGGVSDWCRGIHIHDSMVVFDKGQPHRPTHSRVG
jgi:hypothetical protein